MSRQEQEKKQYFEMGKRARREGRPSLGYPRGLADHERKAFISGWESEDRAFRLG